MHTRRALLVLVGLAAASLSNWALAQSYPVRPVRLVVPFAAGGPSDFAARTVGEALSKRLGQAVVIENKPGADGLIATQAVLGAAADGHTLLFGSSTLVPVSLLKTPAPLDVLTDLAPIASVTTIEWALYVAPDLPVSSIAELVEFARANPNKLSYATSNLGEYLAAAQLMSAAGIKMVRVPYKGFAQVVPDVIAGRVHVNIAPLSAVLAFAEDRRVRLLAVIMPERSRFAPHVPVLAEAGFPGVSVPGWQAVLAPAKTPKAVIDRLSTEIRQALEDPEVKAQFERQAVRLQASTADELATAIKDQLQIWREFIQEHGVGRD